MSMGANICRACGMPAVLVSIHQEKIHLFRSVHADNEGLLDIGGPAGPGGKGHQRGQLLAVFFFQTHEGVADIVDQLIGIRNTEMYRRIDARRTTAGVSRAEDDSTRAGNERLAGGNSSITFAQVFIGEGTAETLVL